MTENIYTFDCGGIMLSYSFIYPETKHFFGRYLTECQSTIDSYDFHITSEYMEENRWLVAENEQSMPFLEFQALMLATGTMLLEHKRALFHGAAFLWKERAWIFTAPSGVGKTTQLRHWKELLKKDVKVINGDKPLLECRDDGGVWVHSSPWKGKEKYGIQGLNAPLGGIVLLKQSNNNKIKQMEQSEAVLPLFTEFVSFPENTEQLECQAEILSQILDSVPVWELENLGDKASAILTRETFERYLEENGHV